VSSSFRFSSGAQYDPETTTRRRLSRLCPSSSPDLSRAATCAAATKAWVGRSCSNDVASAAGVKTSSGDPPADVASGRLLRAVPVAHRRRAALDAITDRPAARPPDSPHPRLPPAPRDKECDLASLKFESEHTPDTPMVALKLAPQRGAGTRQTLLWRCRSRSTWKASNAGGADATPLPAALDRRGDD
jgi:hypothetical protein